MFPPERIVCLTEETVETLYLRGEERRIVGISGYVVRPPRARREKPRVSAFTTADVPKILDLKPDLVLTFSDLQADIAATLIRHGIEVHGFNQRTVPEILMNRVQGGHMAGPRPRLPLSRFAGLSIHQLQRTRASTLFSVSCGFVSEDFARQATNPSGRTSTAPVAVIP